MAKLRTLQSALNGGELSPKLRGRTDIPRYLHGLELGRNAIPLVEGGATRAPGSRFVAFAAGSAVVLIRFKHILGGTLTGWMLEFGDLTIRFFTGGQQIKSGGNPYTLTSPYSAAQLEDLHCDQNDNILYLYHPQHHPKRLIRTADADWTIEDVSFTDYPYQRPANTDAITLTPSATIGNITITASDDFFVAGHDDMTFMINQGIVQITAVTNSTTASATVIKAIPSGLAVLTRTDVTTITISESFVPPVAPDTVVIDTTSVTDFDADTLTTSSTAPPLGITVTKASSSTTLTGTEADADWKMAAWSDLLGWPCCGTFYKQRHILAGSATYPTHVWGSRIGKIHDMTIGALDNDGFSLQFVEATTPIQHLSAIKKLFAFTFDKEITLEGTNGVLTPSSPDINTIGTNGSSTKAQPVQVGGSIYFVSPSGKQLRGTEYLLTKDGYTAPDIGIFASHLLAGGQGIKQMAYTREPHSIIWSVTNNGQLLTLTLDKDQDVTAWTKQFSTNSHSYKSVASVPDSTGADQLWQAVERTVNGTPRVCIEYIDYSLNTHSAVTATSATAKTEWTGLDHLEGQLVDILADGFVSDPQTVAGGKITLPYAASAVEIGHNYVTTIKDLPLDLPQQGTTAQGSNMAVAKIRVRLHETSGCMINGERLSFQKFGPGVLDQPAQLFTGDKQVQNIGRGAEPENSQVTIVQDKPLPLTVLAIIKQVAIND